MLSSTKAADAAERGLSFVSERIARARSRITVLNPDDVLTRDSDEVWEAYYDIEEGIFVAKIVFKSFEKPGKFRKLLELRDVSQNTIRTALKTACENLDIATSDLRSQRRDELIEHLRRARDQLKALVIAGDRASRSLRQKRS